MRRSRILSIFLLCMALVLAGCGGDKKKEKAVDLPQQVSYLDGGVIFRLPEGWMSGAMDTSGFVITNSQALYDGADKDDLANFAGDTFTYAYDPTHTLADSSLPTKENVAVGQVVVAPTDVVGGDLNPTELIKIIFAGAAKDVDDGSEAVASNKAWFKLDQASIKTFHNGAMVHFDTAGGMHGVIGIVRAGQNFGAAILVTDKPDQYMNTFEAIIRSVHLSENPIPTMTPVPQPTILPMPTPLVIVVTATPSAIPLPTMTPFVIPTLPPTWTSQPISCIYIVQSGDTPAMIATSLNVSVNDLSAANPSVDFSHLQSGQPLANPGCGVSMAEPTVTLPATSLVSIDNVLGAGDINNEAVELRNVGGSVINLQGWILTSGGGDVFHFPEFRMFSGSVVDVYTRQGLNTPIALYWNLDHPVWKAGDMVLLLDPSGQVQATFVIGGN